ncbi:metalloprotease [Fusarium albosuccineum]|uniref:Metalloprotease n=1 Tax=Fusarium albosuccineum TaxID=1237068 RepID=A0A8H4LFK8_9HYPO|nr:metalloprotease [Fusarium albosuccineum]
MTESTVKFSYCSAGFKVPLSSPLPVGNLVSKDGSPSFLAANKNLWWPNGTKLKVRFLNGSPKLKEKVKLYSQTWESFANIDFRFIEQGDADIRVGFQWNHDPGTWSYVGKDAQKFALGQNSATMNFGDLDDNSREEVYCRVITHEFGHAIGCVHEHQANPIEWNVAQVLADFKRDYKWDEKTTRSQIIDRERDLSALVKSDFDPNSIMCYYFPASWTADHSSAPTNLDLSATDRSFIAKIYPFQTHNDGELTIDPSIRPWYPPVALNSKAIQFSPPYLVAPRLALGLKLLDIANSANMRVRAAAARVTEDQFALNIDSWADTQLYNASATWLEFSADETDYQGKLVSVPATTLDYRPLNTFPTPDKGGVRRDTEHFDFPDGKYTESPNVLVWLSALDLDRGHNWRVRAKATNVTASGFDLDIETWADTKLYSATASWVAYPKGREGVVNGRVSSGELRNWFPPSASDSRKVKFPARSFDRAPKIFLAISELGLDLSTNLRVKASADRIDASGFI